MADVVQPDGTPTEGIVKRKTSSGSRASATSILVAAVIVDGKLTADDTDPNLGVVV